MRIIAVVAALVMTLATSASTQENEPMPKDTSNPRQAFYMSAADLAATAAKLPSRPSANTTILERYDASSITGLGYRMAIDRRMQPQNGNAHNTEAEMWFVLDGSGGDDRRKTGADHERREAGRPAHRRGNGAQSVEG